MIISNCEKFSSRNSNPEPLSLIAIAVTIEIYGQQPGGGRIFSQLEKLISYCTYANEYDSEKLVFLRTHPLMAGHYLRYIQFR